MNNQFFPGSQVPVPGGCGIGQTAPLVGTYNYILACPQGPGALNPNVPSQTTVLSAGRNATIQYTVINTTTSSIFFRLGDDEADCEALFLDEMGLPEGTVIVGPGDPEVTANRFGDIVACLVHTTPIGFNLLISTNVEVNSIRAGQFAVNIFDQCPVNDVELPCADGCNGMSQFYGNGFYAGGPTAILIEVPALSTTVIKLCSCTQATTGLVGAPALIGQAIPVPIAEVCPPVTVPVNGFVNGGARFANGNGNFNGNNGF